MGNEANKLHGEAIKGKQKDAAALPDVLNIKKYNKIAVIGRGGFGKVYKKKCRSGKLKIKKTESHMP
jgi:uncharacterized protein YgiB involved in biofilm formation